MQGHLVQLNRNLLMVRYMLYTHGFVYYLYCLKLLVFSTLNHATLILYLRAILCKNQTKWEIENFDPHLNLHARRYPGGMLKVTCVKAWLLFRENRTDQ